MAQTTLKIPPLDKPFLYLSETHKTKWDYRNRLVRGDMPKTVDGDIGQPPLRMMVLRKAHVGEVQAGIWSDDVIRRCRKNNIVLL